MNEEAGYNSMRDEIENQMSEFDEDDKKKQRGWFSLEQTEMGYGTSWYTTETGELVEISEVIPDGIKSNWDDAIDKGIVIDWKSTGIKSALYCSLIKKK